MNDELRETLTLLGDILGALHCKTPSGLIEKFLKPAENEDEYLSNEELNEKLCDYIEEFLNSDVDNGCKMIRLGDLYVPSAAIKKWRTDERYSYKNHCQEYLIVLNEDEGSPKIFSNMVAKYSTVESRNEDIEKLLESKLAWGRL